MDKKHPTTGTLSKSIFFFDVDYTLVDSEKGHLAGIEAIKNKIHPKIGQRVDTLFKIILWGMRVKNKDDWEKVPGGKKAFDKLYKNISQLQKRMIQEYKKPKVWSREILIYLAAKDVGINFSLEEAIKGRDIYWQTVREIDYPFHHAVQLFKTLKQLKRPVYLHSSSDSILKISQGEFIYDPSYSQAYKLKRIESLKNKGLYFNKVIIGDPIEKPHRAFYATALKLIEQDLKRPIDPREIIAVDDSYIGDVEMPLKLGFGKGFHFKPGEKPHKISENLFIVGELTQIISLLGS